MFVCMDSQQSTLVQLCQLRKQFGVDFFSPTFFVIFFLIFKPKVNLKKNFKVQIIRSILMVTATSFMFILYKNLT